MDFVKVRVRSRRVVLGLMVSATLVGQLLAAFPAGAAPAGAGIDNVRVQPARTIPLPPEMDPAFYEPDQQVVESKRPGQLIAARRITVSYQSLIPTPVDAWQVSYRSNDTHGNAIPAVTTVLKPRGAPKGGAPRPLLAFNSATDGLARYCEPSYTYQLASAPYQLTGSAAVGNEVLQVQAALAQGWAVTVADTQGPQSAYAAGPLQARIALDGIRAALRFGPLDLAGEDTPVGLSGYSGGAITTNWAAEIADSYTPELNIVGAAAGGTQPELDKTLNLANGQAASGLILAAVIGLSREYPEIDDYINEHITPAGRMVADSKANLCLAWTAGVVPFLDNKALFTGGDPLQNPQVRAVIAKTRMGSTTPSIPLFQYQSNPDWIAPVAPVNRLMQKYCNDPKARVTYTRDHFSEHVSMTLIATPAWMMWLGDRFAGEPAPAGCTTKDVGSMALDHSTWPVWVHTVGDLMAGAFGKPLGVG